MNGVHDMGGMHGFGSIPREENEAVFHASWEGRMFGMLLNLGRHGVHDPDGLRAAVENMEPAQYLGSSYFERWLLVTEKALVEKGFLTREELDSKLKGLQERPESAPARSEDPLRREGILRAVYNRIPSNREVGIVPRFKVGDSVKVRNVHPRGHTRLPRYVRGKTGVIARFHGVHEFHDVVPDGTAALPQPVYNLCFQANELWGDSAEPNESLHIDLWESYLEPAALP